jgi:RHS repeat-associated protein
MNGNSSNSHQYTGREDDGVGVYYYRARYYEPALGRFISEDPLGFAAGYNLYSYVGDDPMNAVDPLGLSSIPHFGIHVYYQEDIDGKDACGIPTGGGCSKVWARYECTCECSGSGWKVMGNLSIGGSIWIYSGHWPYKGRSPVDTSVYNNASAVAHEFDVHIWPAVNTVMPVINKVESKTFKSKDKCEKACGKAERDVRNAFDLSLKESQREEQLPH